MSIRNELLEQILTAVAGGVDSAEFGWADNIANFSSARGNGTSEPTWSDMGNGHYNFKFTTGKELFVTHHVKHDWKQGTNGYPHIHFLVNQTMTVGQQVTWRYAYTIARGHQQGESLLGAETIIDITYTATGAEVVGDHIILECSDLQSFDQREPDTLISGRVELISENVAGLVYGIMCDLHYQTDRHSTLNKAPDFYA